MSCAALRWLWVSALLAIVSCSGRRVQAPAVSAEKVSREALAQYDANKDGFLDKDELKRCPALSDGLKSLDKNKDGRLSGDEIVERIKTYETSRVGLTALSVKVVRDGKPLPGATVTLVPEMFFADALKPAAGTTDANGIANMTTQGSAVPGVTYGMFRVEVSKKDNADQETLPTRYNRQTVFGVEVGPDSPGVLRLSLRGY